MTFRTQWLTTEMLYVQTTDSSFFGVDQSFRTERLGESISLEQRQSEHLKWPIK